MTNSTTKTAMRRRLLITVLVLAAGLGACSPSESPWYSMTMAPHDGTIIELKNNRGREPWCGSFHYGLMGHIGWMNAPYYGWLNWNTPEGGVDGISPFVAGENVLQWRPIPKGAPIPARRNPC